MAAGVILTTLLAGIALILLMSHKTPDKTTKVVLKLGKIGNSELIYENIHTRSAIRGIKREDELQLQTVEEDEVISAILVELLAGSGVCFLKNGGLNHRQVALILRSTWNDGYKFRVTVYSKKK